jgi:hypothetical protein
MIVTTKSIVIRNVTPFNFKDVNQKCRLSLIIGEHAIFKRRYTYTSLHDVISRTY